jgi:antitoxin ParD1/3/4
MSTIHVELTDHFRTFVEAQVSSGRFKDANDVLHEGLRLLEKREAVDREKLDQLRELAEEGFRELDLGLGITIRSREELDALLQGLLQEAQSRAQKESA